jgi:hypothetical protein
MFKLKLKFGKRSFALLTRLADTFERHVQLSAVARWTFSISFGGLTEMPIYKADKPDFDFRIMLAGADSEGNTIPDAPVPAGHTLTVVSDNSAGFEVTQDPADQRLVHAHVGGPNPDGSPSQSNVTANLLDPLGNLVATGAAQVTVTAGDPATITAITLDLPPV